MSSVRVFARRRCVLTPLSFGHLCAPWLRLWAAASPASAVRCFNALPAEITEVRLDAPINYRHGMHPRVDISRLCLLCITDNFTTLSIRILNAPSARQENVSVNASPSQSMQTAHQAQGVNQRERWLWTCKGHVRRSKVTNMAPHTACLVYTAGMKKKSCAAFSNCTSKRELSAAQKLEQRTCSARRP